MFELHNPEHAAAAQEEMEKFVREQEERLKQELENEPLNNETIDKAAEQGSAKEEQGM